MSHKVFRLFFVLILVSGLVAIQSPQSARAAGPWYVSTTGDDSNDCLSPGFACATINGALGKASSGDLINVAEGTYTGNGNEVVMIDKDATFSGGWDDTFTTQSGMSTIDGQGVRQGIIMNSGTTTVIDYFTVQNGFSSLYGGGIYTEGELTLNNSTVTSNTASQYGGGISFWGNGALTINNSTISDNTAGGGGGISAIPNNIPDPGAITLNNSSVINNHSYSGAGIWTRKNLILNNSAIKDNTASEGGGGIYNFDASIMTLNNSTITGNQALNGGGILLDSYSSGGDPDNIAILNSTLSNNTAQAGGGINIAYSFPARVVTVRNSIIAKNTASSAADCSGSINTSDHNIIGSTTGCTVTSGIGDQFNVNPLISTSAIGAPAYHFLLAGSPAIDAGDSCLSTDQRGVARPQGAACDIGSYEYTTPGSAVSLSVVSGSGQRAETTFAFSNALQAAALDTQGSPVSGVTIDFTAPASGPSGTFVDSGNNTTAVVTDEGGVATTSTFIANDQAGAYTVVASASGLGSVNFNLEQVDRPANDNFANAEPFTSLPFSATVDITNATNEQPNEPQNCDTMDRTVWYSFTPTESMVVVANSADGAIYTNVNIYHAGSGISDLQFLSCTGADAFTTFIAEANQTYYFQAGSAFGEVGYIRIDLDLFPAPMNDNFAAATPISSLPSTIDFDTTAATFETNEPSACGYPAPPYRTIWYAFTASQDGSISASIPISNFAPFLAVYGGTDFNDLTQLGCGQYSNKVTFDAVQSQTYYIQVGGYYGEGGQGQFLLENAPAPQANFYFYPGDPSKYDTIQFCSSSYDPGNVGIESFTWDFGDGATATEGCATHRYTADGDYTVQHTVTTFDGRTAAATPQVVQVRTHDVAITKITAPNSANSGQTKSITVTLRNKVYPETVQVDLYKSSPEGFVWVATVTKSVPALSGNRTTAFYFNYLFTGDDASIGKVTFKAIATIIGARDILPIDNEAISSPPTRVGR